MILSVMEKIKAFLVQNCDKILFFSIGFLCGAGALWLYLDSQSWLELLRTFDKSVI